MRGRLVLVLALALALACGAGACAARLVQLPVGEGEAFPGYEEALQGATRGCREVRSLSAELAVSGRVDGRKLRGRVMAGLTAEGRIRLEGAAPFGPPVFILVASGPAATLLLPRDGRVLTGEPASAILLALVGVDLRPADLLAILAGCVVPDPQATGGRSFSSGWARLDLSGGATAFLQRDSRRGWVIRAGLWPRLRLDYEPAEGSAPASVRLQTAAEAGTASDLRIGLSQVEVNVPLGAEVFAVKVPADAVPITLTELRQAGPIGEKR